MLNDRQRQFRKQMKQVGQAKRNQKDTYSYKDQRYASEKPKRRFKKPLLQIGGTISILVLMWNIYVFSSSVMLGNGVARLLSSDQLEVHQYIQESSEIELALNDAVNSLMNRYNEKTLTSFHIEELQKNLFELQKRMATDDSRFLVMSSYLDEQFNLAYQLANVLKTEESNVKYTELTGIIERQNALLARRNATLMSILDSEAIPYEQLEDGSISYQYEM